MKNLVVPGTQYSLLALNGGGVFGEMGNLKAKEILEVCKNPPTFAKIHQISSKSR